MTERPPPSGGGHNQLKDAVPDRRAQLPALCLQANPLIPAHPLKAAIAGALSRRGRRIAAARQGFDADQPLPLGAELGVHALGGAAFSGIGGGLLRAAARAEIGADVQPAALPAGLRPAADDQQPGAVQGDASLERHAQPRPAGAQGGVAVGDGAVPGVQRLFKAGYGTAAGADLLPLPEKAEPQRVWRVDGKFIVLGVAVGVFTVDD